MSTSPPADDLPAEMEAIVRARAKHLLARCLLAMFPEEFFPEMRAAAAAEVRAWYEPLAFRVRSLEQRVAKVMDRQAEVLHRLEVLEQGMTTLLGELGYEPQAESQEAGR